MRHSLKKVRDHTRQLLAYGTYKLSRRRNKFLVLIAVTNILFLLQILINTLSFPNLNIGSTQIGFTSKKQLVQLLTTIGEHKRKFNIHGKIYEYSYDDLGVYIDPDATVENVWQSNKQIFPINVAYWIRALFRSEHIDPVLHFSGDYYAFVEKTIYDASAGQDIYFMDQPTKTIGYIEQAKRSTLDPYALEVILREYVGDPHHTITAPLLPVENIAKVAIEKVNVKLERTYRDKLILVVGGSGFEHKFISLSPETLRKISKASVTPDKTGVTFAILTPELRRHVAGAIESYGDKVNQDKFINLLAKGVRKGLDDRARGVLADSIGVSLDDGPNSDGTLADKYIEVDISQQRLYTFQNGALMKSYRVSTGKDYPTPTGTFEILNKTGLGFSNIYNVWMPYWMGFKYSEELRAYFGIHELPYAVTEGATIQRPRDLIGQPSTGGCVALDVGEAKEVYQFAHIGTKLVIYQ